METVGSSDLSLLVRDGHMILAFIRGEHNRDLEREFRFSIGEDESARFTVKGFAIQVPFGYRTYSESGRVWTRCSPVIGFVPVN